MHLHLSFFFYVFFFSLAKVTFSFSWFQKTYGSNCAYKNFEFYQIVNLFTLKRENWAHKHCCYWLKFWGWPESEELHLRFWIGRSGSWIPSLIQTWSIHLDHVLHFPLVAGREAENSISKTLRINVQQNVLLVHCRRGRFW